VNGICHKFNVLVYQTTCRPVLLKQRLKTELCLFDMVVCCWRFITVMVLQRHDLVCTIFGFIFTRLVFMFCVSALQLFPYTVRLVRRPQYQFTRSW